MAKQLTFFYDKKGDILDISVGKPRKAVSLEIETDVFIRLDNKKRIIGFMLLNFEKRCASLKNVKALPIQAEFNMPSLLTTL